MSKENQKVKSGVSASEIEQKKRNGEEEDNPSAAAPTDDGDTAAIEDPAEQLAAVASERDRLADEKQELEDRLLRRQAEFENFRRRAERERQDFAAYAAMETVGSLLPVIDDFERALKAVPPDLGPDHDYVKGIQMIYQRLLDALIRAGLEPIDSVGKPFDPNIHHAVERVPTDEAEDQTVLEEWQRGYNFKGRLLREAMVRVAVKPTPAEPSAEESSSEE